MSEIEKKTKNELVAERLNQSVLSVLNSDQLVGFEKSYKIASAIDFLKENLTAEYMKPIMAMQGSRLGFKTDKDNAGGYPMEKVKECLIDAVLTGVEPYGNQFNIIAGNMYVTKEGYRTLLSKVKGLKYTITPQLPRISAEKVNNFMGADAVIGKATRKARAWLFNQISDIEISDGDVEDAEFTIVKEEPTVSEKKQALKDKQSKIEMP